MKYLSNFDIYGCSTFSFKFWTSCLNWENKFFNQFFTFEVWMNFSMENMKTFRGWKQYILCSEILEDFRRNCISYSPPFPVTKLPEKSKYFSFANKSVDFPGRKQILNGLRNWTRADWLIVTASNLFTKPIKRWNLRVLIDFGFIIILLQ